MMKWVKGAFFGVGLVSLATGCLLGPAPDEERDQPGKQSSETQSFSLLRAADLRWENVTGADEATDGAGIAGASGQQHPACQLFFAEQNLCGSLHWQHRPTSTATSDQGFFFLKFWSPEVGPNQEAVDLGEVTLSLELDMPTMGHGTDQEPQIAPAETSSGQVIPGVYAVSQVHFNCMAGPWVFHFRLQPQERSLLPRHEVTEATYEFRV